jgi:hypothetical protein
MIVIAYSSDSKMPQNRSFPPLVLVAHSGNGSKVKSVDYITNNDAPQVDTTSVNSLFTILLDSFWAPWSPVQWRLYPSFLSES